MYICICCIKRQFNCLAKLSFVEITELLVCCTSASSSLVSCQLICNTITSLTNRSQSRWTSSSSSSSSSSSFPYSPLIRNPLSRRSDLGALGDPENKSMPMLDQREVDTAIHRGSNIGKLLKNPATANSSNPGSHRLSMLQDLRIQPSPQG